MTTLTSLPTYLHSEKALIHTSQECESFIFPDGKQPMMEVVVLFHPFLPTLRCRSEERRKLGTEANVPLLRVGYLNS